MKRYVLLLLIPGFLLLINIYNSMAGNVDTGRADYSYREAVENDAGKRDMCIFIDLNERQLYLFEGNKLVSRYAVAIGKPASPSPIGVWKIKNMRKNWGSGFGSRWLGLNVPWGIYGIHGTNKPYTIGSAASHGCFRMYNADVEELYDRVDIGTPVVVYGGPYGNLGSDLTELYVGDRSSKVLEVQKRLKNLGYYTGELDGIFGEGMKSALIKYKKDHNLPLNDMVDFPTYKSLNIFLFE